MKAYYDHGGILIHRGDCREVLPEIRPVDAVVTDPPYGLSFMGKGWDRGVPGVEFWELIRDAMKPGAHLLAFGGTRTFHRLTCAIEDAGFEIRDCIMWLYGSGFPKSHDVSKAIDKALGVEREIIGLSAIGGGGASTGGNYKFGSADQETGSSGLPVTSPATTAAKQWEGWGTALKPAWEPIILARKPLEGTVAENVLKYGVGALNIDGARVGEEKITTHSRGNNTAFPKRPGEKTVEESGRSKHQNRELGRPRQGRWPANVIHDGSEEVVELFPDSQGQLAPVTGLEPSSNTNNVYGEFEGRPATMPRGDAGSAARFFYCAKASRTDRGGSNDHPTVKPLALMRYLCLLIAPRGGVVLDPFMGSGSTLRAAKDLGEKAIGIEIEERYCKIAAQRLVGQDTFNFGGSGR